jgi:asparagine synthase (glutamine-hydrolysing)
MSGLAAVIHWDGRPVAPGVLDAMANRAVYRSPHGVRQHVEGWTGFAHLALNVTPESAREHQPLVEREAGLVLAADARIDNRQSLIRSLQLDPAASDPALILSAYQKWGNACASHLQGDFAFVIWNGRERCAYAARDHMGIRSLYYAFDGRTLCFASDAWQVCGHPAFKAVLCDEAALEWLTGTQTNRYSMFRDVLPVPAGSFMRVDANQVQVQAYWAIDPARRVRYKNHREYGENLISVLDEAVHVRLRSSANAVGTELSGGMDSTVIAALANPRARAGSQRLEAVSYHYPTLKSCDETDLSQSAARHIGIATHLVDAEKFGLPNYPAAFEPFAESPWFASHPLLQEEYRHFQSRGVNVVLTGSGGDELTGGFHVAFHRFWRGELKVFAEILQECAASGESGLAGLYRRLLKPGLPQCAHDLLRLMLTGTSPPERWPSWVPEEQHARLEAMRAEASRQAPAFESLSQRAMYENLFTYSRTAASTSSYEYLSTPYGIEVRHPFLDKNVVEFCFAVPPELWHRNAYPKWLLRHATAGILPDAVRWRREKSEVSEALSIGIERNCAYVRRILEIDCRNARHLLCARGFADTYVRETASGRRGQRAALTGTFTLKQWLRLFQHELADCGASV